MRKRTLARQAALQALYQWDVQGDAFAAQLDRFLQEWAKAPDVADFARELVEGVRVCLPELDKAISGVARNWSLDRMPVVDRTILRLGVYELLYRDDIPANVSINEAIDLAKKFSTKDSGAFVNGVLDHIMTGAAKKGKGAESAAKRAS